VLSLVGEDVGVAVGWLVARTGVGAGVVDPSGEGVGPWVSDGVGVGSSVGLGVGPAVEEVLAPHPRRGSNGRYEPSRDSEQRSGHSPNSHLYHVHAPSRTLGCGHHRVRLVVEPGPPMLEIPSSWLPRRHEASTLRDADMPMAVMLTPVCSSPVPTMHAPVRFMPPPWLKTADPRPERLLTKSHSLQLAPPPSPECARSPTAIAPPTVSALFPRNVQVSRVANAEDARYTAPPAPVVARLDAKAQPTHEKALAEAPEEEM
jgi:hypothetical protein